MTQKSNLVFKGLSVIAWIIFVGLCIEAGGLIVNFFFSLYRPEVVPNLFQKLDLADMYEASPSAFFKMYSFILIISVLKVVLFYIVIRLVSKIDLLNPFNEFVSSQILQISYYTLSIGLLSYLARQSANDLHRDGFDVDDLSQFWSDSQAFILMAAIVYVIAVIFKRGVDLQNENDLTV